MNNCVLEHIKKVRQNKKIEQKDIAEKIGVSQSAYNQKENGKQKIRMTEVLNLFNVLNIRMFLNNIEIKNILDITNILKEQRNNKGYTQDYLHISVGYKCKQSYCNKENGKTTMYLDEFLKICSVLNIDISFNIPIVQTLPVIKTDERNVKVKCINTGKVYNSIKEAAEEVGANPTLITKVCRGQRKSAGKLDGQRLTWKYVDV